MLNKKVVQLFLFFLLIVTGFIFYQTYFSDKKNKEINLKSQRDAEIIDNENLDKQNNLIKNLKYSVNLDNNREYVIKAELSELKYENNIEIVRIQKVFGVFIDNTNSPINISSNYAIYNRTSSNTLFEDKVKIEYIDNVITSDKLDLNFEKNVVTIYDNVVYEGLEGSVIADNITIDLISKEIEFYMHDKSNKVKITVN